MRYFHKMAALAAVMAVSAGSFASASTIFTYAYEGDALPQDSSTNPQWTKVLDSGQGASESVSGGILTTTTAAKSDYIDYRITGGPASAWNPTAAGTTFEVRLKPDFANDGATYVGGLFIGTGQRAWRLSIGPDIIYDPIGGGAYRADFTGFHVYRFTQDGTANGALELYMDGGTSPVYSWNGAAATYNWIDFGDLFGGSVAGQMQWDYVRWTNAGAFAPVPEPAMLSLAVLGMLPLMRRRRT